jgi:hypothetical protein
MTTEATKLTYWTTTVLFSAMMAVSAFLYLTSAAFQERFSHLGFPAYFRVELALFKCAGVLTLLLSVSARVKEWAYAGFFITMVSASTAHVASGDGPGKVLAPVMVGGILAVSYVTYRKLNHG